MYGTTTDTQAGSTARWLVAAFFALAIIFTPLLMASWFALCPEYGDPACPGTSHPQDYFPAVRAAQGQLLQLFLLINLLVPYIFPLGFIGMGLASWRRAPWLTIVGVAFGWISAIAWGPVADQIFTWTTMARENHDATFAALLLAVVADWHVYFGVGAVWVIGHLLAYIILGVAFWRARVAPAWSAIVIVLAAPVMGPLAYGFQQNALQIFGYLMVAVASIPVARYLWPGPRPETAGKL